MMIYDIVSKDEKILNYLKTIDDNQEKTLPSDHGTKHIMFCVNFVEKFLRAMNENEKVIDLAKSAAFMHDLGCIYGKDNHVENSVLLVREYFKTLSIDNSDKEIIIDAIKNHSAGKELNHIISAILVLADKCHWSHDRLFETSKMDIVHICVKSIKRIDANIEKENLVITYNVFENFSENALLEVNKIKSVFPKIADYLGKKLMIKILYDSK